MGHKSVSTVVIGAQDINGFLSATDLFSCLSQVQLVEIARCFHCKSYRSEETIITHGECAGEVFFVFSGEVKATLFSPSGREICYQELGSGELFGELAAIDGLPRSAHVIASKASRVIFLSKQKFIEILARHPQVAMKLMQKMASQIRFLSDRVYEFSAMDVNSRVRIELVRIAQSKGVKCDNGVLIDSMPTHQELASRISTHREAVTRELNRLSKSGLIFRDSSGIIIRDLNELESSTLAL